MPIEITKVGTFQTRFMQSFVNLTELNSTTYPATTSIRIDPVDSSSAFPDTTQTALTSITIYDQWALRTKAAT